MTQLAQAWLRDLLACGFLAAEMREDGNASKPIPEQQNFGERVLHVAQVNLQILQELGASVQAPTVAPPATSKTEAMLGWFSTWVAFATSIACCSS